MRSELRTREFRPADAMGLTELLHRAYAELAEAGMNFTSASQTVDATLMRASAGRCLIVEADDRFVATVTISFPPTPVLHLLTPASTVPRRAWLNQLAVHPDLRGTGLASDLWRRGLAWAHAQGATSIGVDTAAPALHLVALYERWGFGVADRIQIPGKTYPTVILTRHITETDAAR